MRPSIKQLKELVHYDPKTGHFTRKWKTKPTFEYIGQKKQHGYISFQVCGHRDYAHRFAWAYMTGEWPKELDHINGDRSDNRWLNLRKATRFLNNGNRKKHKGCLPKGVVKIKGRGGRPLNKPYWARIQINRKQISLGLFSNPNDAHSAYMVAARQYYGDFARAK